MLTPTPRSTLFPYTTLFRSIIDRNYCFFEYKNINWDAVYKNYSSRITPNMNNEALFKLMGQMLAELKDGHVNLTASHDVTRYWEWHENYPANFDSEIQDRKSTRLNSSHVRISYAVFCLKKKKKK